MDLNEIRSKFLSFFQGKGHTIIPSASLIPENDPTTLFTGSGMQPLLPYLLGQTHPSGTRLVDSQKCFRTGDIDEIGDNRHTTFFEMLGNWSLGDYFKQDQLTWIFTFLTEVIGLDPQKLYVTAFAGDEIYNLPRDAETVSIWKALFISKGIDANEAYIGSEQDGYERGMHQEERIFYYDVSKNWWSRSGVPGSMPEGEPGGGDSEIFYDFGTPHDTRFGPHCHPNCDCGRFVEICNSVFMEYYKKDGGFVPLAQKNVDFGGGLERIAMAAQNTEDVFLVAYKPIVEALETHSGKSYGTDAEHTRYFRIVADHMKAITFLMADGILPAKNDRGYFVRRLLRRGIQYADKLGIENVAFVVDIVIAMYQDAFPYLVTHQDDIRLAVEEEEKQFRTALKRGIGLFNAWKQNRTSNDLPADLLFTLVTTHGFPLEMIQEVAQEEGIRVNVDTFHARMREHQDLSRKGAEKKFKGGLADTSEQTTRLHTAHHLLLRALQLVLGPEVKQRGSNITQERLRIDFSYGQKLTDAQKEEIERMVNTVIQEDLPVIKSEMEKTQAEALHAEHEFGAVYPDRVTIYSVGPKEATIEEPCFEKAFSIEFCGGPHVSHTGELGIFTIQKEEGVGGGIRRIKATLSNGS